MTESCSNCRFYRKKECHAHAPIAKVTPKDPDSVIALWPITDDDEWCGEWELNDVPPKGK